MTVSTIDEDAMLVDGSEGASVGVERNVVALVECSEDAHEVLTLQDLLTKVTGGSIDVAGVQYSHAVLSY